MWSCETYETETLKVMLIRIVTQLAASHTYSASSLCSGSHLIQIVGKLAQATLEAPSDYFPSSQHSSMARLLVLAGIYLSYIAVEVQS